MTHFISEVRFECLILCSLLYVQPYTGDDEELTGPLPPNPFSEQSEKVLEVHQIRVDGKTRLLFTLPFKGLGLVRDIQVDELSYSVRTHYI